MNLRLLLCTITLAALSACGKSAPVPTVAPAMPLTAELQKAYDGSCKTCHSIPASGAPQVGDAKAWAPRLAQGKDMLLSHVINGYQKMPPMGLCMQCSEDEFIALTEHMSGSQLK